MNDRMIKNIIKIGIINTIRFNLHYFGVESLFKPTVFVSKYVDLRTLEGEVICKSNEVGAVKLGFGNPGIADAKRQYVVWQNSGTVVFDGSASIKPGCKLINLGGRLELGKNFSINCNSIVVCRKEIKFGENNLISWNCSVMDTDFHHIFDVETGYCPNNDKEIIFGDRVWVGAFAICLKGIKVANDTVIAAGTVVTKSLIKGNSIYVGNQCVKQNIRWEY